MEFVVFLVTFVLLRAVGVALSRGPLSLPETNADKDVPMYSQTVHVTTNTTRDVGCIGEGRCKPCSRFEMNRQVKECLRTGYRQWAFCSHEKASKYISCHYLADHNKQRAFWILQAIAVLVGSLSLVVVHWRQARIDRMMAHRIEQQIRT